VHRKIYTDGEFGCLKLSDNLGSLLYVAEKKRPKTFPFLSQGEVPESAQVRFRMGNMRSCQGN